MITIEPVTLTCTPGPRGYRDSDGGPDDVPSTPPEQRHGWRLIIDGQERAVALGEDGRQHLEQQAEKMNADATCTQ